MTERRDLTTQSILLTIGSLVVTSIPLVTNCCEAYTLLDRTSSVIHWPLIGLIFFGISGVADLMLIVFWYGFLLWLGFFLSREALKRAYKV